MEPILTTHHYRAQCVDLRATFKGQYRFGWDEAYRAERPDYRKMEAAWLTTIPCQYGQKIFPWGGRLLGAYATQQRLALMALPVCTVRQGGVGCPEVIVTFDVDDIEAVAILLHARRPRTLSPEQRERLIARGRAFHFKARNDERPPGEG